MRTRIAWLALLAFFSASAPTKGGEKAAPFQPPQVLSTVEAPYPATSIQGGTVVLEVTVSASGAIGDIRVIQGAKGFTREAIETVKKWKFAAARFEGKPPSRWHSPSASPSSGGPRKRSSILAPR